MSEQHTPLPDDFHTFLVERGPDAYALVWVDEAEDQVGWEATEAPRVGESGIAAPGADLTRITVETVARGRAETLSAWLRLDDGTGQLAVLTVDEDGLREHSPGELAAELPPDTDQVQLTEQLASWLYRRNINAPQGLELGWKTAAAAWTCHMRALASVPPPSVLNLSLRMSGEPVEATADLVMLTAGTAAKITGILERPILSRADLAMDWRYVSPLAADVPALRPMADWLLNQLVLRDAHAQQLRAVLEPDITDHLRDRRASGDLPDAGLPVLDEERAAHLAQARETVLAYTAAAHAEREQEAQQLLDAFPVPARSLETSGPAAAWRRSSRTAQEAVEDLNAQRAAITAEESTDLFADPDLLHAEVSYLNARRGQLDLMHGALGRLAFPAPTPRDLPEALAPVAAGQTQRRITEAFGTPERAAQALDGQIRYQLQQPVPARRRTTTIAETDLLTRTRAALEQHTAAAGVPLNEEQRARLQKVMARPTAPAGTGPAALTAHDEAHTQAVAAVSTTPGAHR